MAFLLNTFMHAGGHCRTLYLSLCTQLDPMSLVAAARAAKPKHTEEGAAAGAAATPPPRRDPASSNGLRQRLLQHERQQQLGLLLLLLSCDAVLLLHAGPDLDVGWLTRLRACQASRTLLTRALAAARQAAAPADGGEGDAQMPASDGPSPEGEPRTGDVGALLRGMCSRPPTLLMLACQVRHP